MQHHQAKVNAAHGERIQNLQLDEQQLRNDWLRSQIANSALKRAQLLANAARGSGQGTPGPGPQEEGAIHFGNDTVLPTGATTSSQDAEDRYWEIGGAAMGLHNIGYDSAGVYLGSVDDEIKRLEQMGILPQPLAGNRNNPYRWRESQKYGKYRLTRKPVQRPKYPNRKKRDTFEYYNSP